MTNRVAQAWLVVRLVTGITWLEAGVDKLLSPSWASGMDVKTFLTTASHKAGPDGRPRFLLDTVTFDVQNRVWSSLVTSGNYRILIYVVPVLELVAALSLLGGIYTGVGGVAALAMSSGLAMAGASRTNTLMSIGAVMVIAGWRVAGRYGLDYDLLPATGRWLGREWFLIATAPDWGADPLPLSELAGVAGGTFDDRPRGRYQSKHREDVGDWASYGY